MKYSLVGGHLPCVQFRAYKDARIFSLPLESSGTRALGRGCLAVQGDGELDVDTGVPGKPGQSRAPGSPQGQGARTLPERSSGLPPVSPDGSDVTIIVLMLLLATWRVQAAYSVGLGQRL